MPIIIEVDGKKVKIEDAKCVSCGKPALYGIIDGNSFKNVCEEHFQEYQKKYDKMLKNMGGKEVTK